MHAGVILLLVLTPFRPQDAIQTEPFEKELKAIASGDAEQQETALVEIWISGPGKDGKPNPRVINAILPLLKSPNADLRRQACLALPSVGATPDVFLPLCKDKNPDVRKIAGGAYFETGGSLTKARFILADKEPDVRANAAVWYLESGGEPSEVVFLFDDQSPWVRRRVAGMYLKQNGDPKPVLKLVNDEDASVRRDTGSALIRRGAVSPVLPLLDDPDGEVGAAIVRSLVMYAREPEHYRAAMKSKYRDVRSGGALALLARREITLLEVLPHLVDDNEENLIELLSSLDRDQRTEVKPLLTKWLTGDDEFRSETAERTLNQWGIATETLKEARQGLTNPDLDVRIATVRRLTGQPLDLEPLIPELTTALAEEGGTELSNYVSTLAIEHRLRGLVPALRPHMTDAGPDGPGTEARMWIARAVAELDSDDVGSVELLAKLTDSPQKEIRIDAARHLLNLKLKPPRIFHVMKWLKKGVARPQNSMVGMWSRWILARCGEPIIPTITKWLADDSNLPVQAAAVEIPGQFLLDQPQTDEDRDRVQAIVESLLPEFAGLLGSKDIQVKTGAAIFLGHAKNEFGERDLDWPRLECDLLTTLAKMPDPDMRQLTTFLLGLYEFDQPARRLGLLEQLRNDRLPAVRAHAHLATLKVPNADHDSVTEKLIAILGQLDSGERQLTLSELDKTDVDLKLALPTLFELLDGGDVRGLEDSFHTVGKAAIPGLTKRLSDGRPQVRNDAAAALGLIGEPIAADGLIQLLDDGESKRSALEALLQLRELPPKLAPRLITIVKPKTDETWSTDPLSIQLLGKLGPVASDAISLLARQDYELTDSYTGGGADVVPEKAALMAAALATIEPNRDVGLMGFRKILTGITTGRTWLYESGSSDKRSGYEIAIDSILEIGDRCNPLIPKLVEIAEPPGQLIHPAYRALAAYALTKLQPEKAAYWTNQARQLYDGLSKYATGRRAIKNRFGFDD